MRIPALLPNAIVRAAGLAAVAAGFALTTIIAAPAPAATHGPEGELRLLPQPHHLELRSGAFQVTEETRVFLPADSETPELIAAKRLRDTIAGNGGPTMTIDRPGIRDEDFGGHIVLTVQDPPSTEPKVKEGYHLVIEPDGIELEGRSMAGVFYGLQTLTQLAEQFGSELPALVIEDEPDFEWRGYHQDVSRGRVPTMESLEWQIDYIAAHKGNMYQLYVEHPFDFRFNPDIAQNDDALTPEQLLELDLYCRERRITFVPSLQSFGHMAGVLSLPEYRHLADVPLEVGWDDLTWRQRMFGATLNTVDPEARELLAKMWDAYLPLFSAPFINASADETYDLGRGQGAEKAEEIGVGRLYLSHIEYMSELSDLYDKRLMIWGDIVKQHPELIPEVPEDTIMLNWGYFRTTRFDESRLFPEAGLDFMVCPGTSGWRRILNDILNAEINIRGFIEAGQEYDAIGVLNTDWGDYGHYNVPAGSLHGKALGLALSWNVEQPEQEQFDAIWSVRTFGPAGPAVIAAWRTLNEAYLDNMTWIMLHITSFDAETGTYGRTDREGARRFRTDGIRLARALERPDVDAEEWIVAELHHAARAMDLLGEKMGIIFDLDELEEGESSEMLAARLSAFADRSEMIFEEYRDIWLAHSRPDGLEDIQLHVDRMIAAAREKADELEP